MDYDDGVRQHVALATGGKLASGDFGVKPLNHSQGRSMAPAGLHTAGHVGDGARSARPPVKHMRHRMRAQSNPDHGGHR